jgi:hypothetical protein
MEEITQTEAGTPDTTPVAPTPTVPEETPTPSAE